MSLWFRPTSYFIVSFRYENNCYIPGSLTRAVYPAFYEGSEFVISGQLASNRRSDFESRVASIAVTSPMELTASGNSRRNILKRGDFPRFVERFWAYLNIKRLEDTILSTTDTTDHILAGARIVELAQRVHKCTHIIYSDKFHMFRWCLLYIAPSLSRNWRC